MNIIDRRLNPAGKSLANRQRFLRRARELVRRAVREHSGQRSIREVENGGEIAIPIGGVREPNLRHASRGGTRDYVLPGNREYMVGDVIPRPPSDGDGAGSEGSTEGDGEDSFLFALSRDEFLDLFLEDLELPDMAKRRLRETTSVTWQRAGYSVSGSPANLALTRTMRNSLSRRIALKRPRPEDLAALRDELAAAERRGDDADRIAELRAALDRTLLRSQRIPYIDPLDIRYRRFEATPRPVAQAVMFCLMDVSGSMTAHMKDLAKRFFALLYVFLRRRYEHVDIVFIRHTHHAQEVDEDTFFHSTETGGTVVSTALEEMARVIRTRYPPDDWNIYAAQASDGDNASSDSPRTARLLADVILPVCQYYAYLEVGQDGTSPSIGFTNRESDLWRTYRLLGQSGTPVVARKVSHRREIYPVFRELFQRRTSRNPAPQT